MSIAKICKALFPCRATKDKYIPDPLPPVHTGGMPITISVGNKGHHKYTSTEVDIHEALSTPDMRDMYHE